MQHFITARRGPGRPLEGGVAAGMAEQLYAGHDG